MRDTLVGIRSIEFTRGIPILPLAVAVLLPALAYVISSLIVSGKNYWLVGMAVAAISVYLILIQGKFEVGVILYVVISFFWEIGLARGAERFGEIRIQHSFLFLLALFVLCFLVRADPSSRAVPGARERGQGRILCLMSGYLAVMLLSLLAREDGPWAFNYWILYGLRGSLLVLIMCKALNSENAFRALVVLLLSLGLFLSLADNLLLLTGQRLIPFSLGYGYQVQADPQETVKAGLRLIRIRSVFGDPPFGGAFMAALLPLALVQIFQWRHWLLKLAFILGSMSIFVNIVAYADRGTWLGVLVSLAIFGMAMGRAVAVALVVFLLGAVLAAEMTGVSLARNVSSLSDVSYQVLRSDRWVLWMDTLNALPRFPLLLGTGFRNDQVFASTLAAAGTPYVGLELFTYGGEYMQPHNSYLDLLIKAGVPVFLFLASLVASICWLGVRALRVTSDRASVRPLLAGAIAGFAAFGTEAFFDRTFFVYTLHVTFWLFLGLIYSTAVYLLRSREVIPSTAANDNRDRLPTALGKPAPATP
ncbi:MAG: O-antigen ligase family protein [Chloroflexi bacterium]|nr:O-antigen ligase family protein [Chloroflexota bacterium]